ncbi:RNA-binding component of cleavage and polyadenylation factor [Basidiobolus ranarum]|uniref:mRNA 3'-end-processing protein n=1 Tax=Basidiobolus ranarum TaxID=34480 RepID=A0ABR2WJG0_9FUNG
MPECWFYSKFNECSNGDECIYLHIDPESKIKECPWYARGFCKHGPNCRHKHVRMVACQLYLSGFCPQGPNCPNGHPKYELPTQNKEQVEAQSTDAAHSTNPDSEEPQQFQQQGNYRPREEVTCFKCGQKGHYANRCPIPRI